MFRLSAIATLVLAFLTANSAHARLNIDLTGTPGNSIINISLSGSITEPAGSGGTGYNWFPMDFPTTDFFTMFPEPITGTTMVTNATTTGLSSIDYINLGFASEFQLHASPQMFANAENVLVFSGSGTFELPGSLTFDDFNMGIFQGSIHDGGATGEEVTLNVASAVPEPSTVALFLLGGIGLAGYQNRKTGQVQ